MGRSKDVPDTGFPAQDAQRAGMRRANPIRGGRGGGHRSARHRGLRGRGEAAGARIVALDELRPCAGLPKVPHFRCGSIRVPFEREDTSLGRTEIGFAVRRRDDRGSPSRGAIFAVEGGPGYSNTGTASAYVKLFRGLLRHREARARRPAGAGSSDLYDCPDLSRGAGPSSSPWRRARGASATARPPTAPRPPRTTSTTCVARSATAGSPCTGGPTGRSSASRTPTVTATC
jgi:hypothetical protein